MRVAVVSTLDARGGAPLMALRLHRALLAEGVRSTYVVRYRTVPDEPIEHLAGAGSSEEQGTDALGALDALTRARPVLRRLLREEVEANRSERTNTFFSLPTEGFDLAGFAPIAAADVVNLHWVAEFATPETVARLLAVKPVVWTLHDQNPLTGGCHYDAGCEGWLADCAPCPQLACDRGLPAETLARKRALWTTSLTQRLAFVSPSRWLAECARRSPLLGGARVATIHNSLDLHAYAPPAKGKAAAKAALGLPPEAVVFCCGSSLSDERRKGLPELAAALAHFLDSRTRLKDAPAVRLLTFGPPSPLLQTEALAALPRTDLGALHGDAALAAAYAAADLFVLPSLEDNLPNTMVEAMACGVPVLAFAAGGMADFIEDGATGRLVPAGDAHALGEALVDLGAAPERLEAMGRRARSHVERHCDPAVQTQTYLELFEAMHRVASAAPAAAPAAAPSAAESPAFLGPSCTPRLFEAYQRAAHAELTERDAELTRLHQAAVERDALREELAGVRASIPYRLGRALTSPARLLRDRLRSGS